MKSAVAILALATLTASQTVSIANYCNALIANCPASHGIDTTTTCATVFANFNLGSLTDTNNTIGCRYKFLTDPVLNATATKCQYAGPTGGGKCGQVIDGACQAATTACAGVANAAYATYAECQQGLAPEINNWGWQQGTSGGSEDSLECRAYHGIAYLVSGLSVHCGHFNLTSSTCNGPVMPNPTHYCETVTYQCAAVGNVQYNSMTDCMNSVGAWNATPADARATTATNSLGCREYHAQAALQNASLHCQHAGPSGGNACGTFAQGWDSLALHNCNNSDVEFAEDGMGETTLNAAVPIGNTGPYHVLLDQAMDTQVCRIYHLTVAGTLPAAHCSHGGVDGGGVCGNDTVSNLCTYIGGVCGFGTNTYQYATQAACTTAMKSIVTGSFADRTTNTLGCRFYHASVAGQYLGPGGSLSSGTNAATTFQQHCSHVLASTPTGGCNAAATTQPPSSASGAPGVSVLLALIACVASILAL